MERTATREPVGGAIHLWRVWLDQPPQRLTRLFDVLDDAERLRAARLARLSDRIRFAVAHAALREILGSYAGVPASDLHFAEARNGKPVLDGSGPHFSLSHSDGIALVAVAADRAVGVDVERVSRDRDLDAVARRYFGADELGWINAGGESSRAERFFRLWTCKESCLKVDGLGLRALETIRIRPDPRDRPRTCGWGLTEIAPGPSYVATVAARGAPPALRVATWHHNNTRIDMVIAP
jgi:4'-phosphopantetheinyl transferase